MDNELVERVAEIIKANTRMVRGCEVKGDCPHCARDIKEASAAVLAELAGELRDETCEWWEDGEMWESSCGVAYMFNSDGPEDNGHRFCHKCGKRIAIDEARHG